MRVLLNFGVDDGTTSLTLVRPMAHGLRLLPRPQLIVRASVLLPLDMFSSDKYRLNTSALLCYFRDITRFSEDVAEEYRARYRKMHNLVVTAHRAEREVSAHASIEDNVCRN